MSAAALTQFLVDVTRGRLARDFAERPDAVIAEARLSETERQALRDRDLAALWRSGAHPMALLYFNRACGGDNDRYYRCISEASAPSSIG